jgi:MoaA/NifB/PqqE/SkfB family radical SAM enzyme
MKVRKEKSGLHFFERETGMHLLFDEKKFGDDEICNSPRTFSIALTNTCDLKCYFCYAPKSRHALDYDYLTSVICEADRLGVLELTFGGGEPLLYPYLVELVSWTHSNTKMAINFTTHGHHLSKPLVDSIKGKVSKIRISIDGLEPRYSNIRKKTLQSLEDTIITNVKGKLRFGINTVFDKDYIDELPTIIEYAKNLGAEDILLIPEHSNGNIDFTKDDFEKLNRIINENQKSFQIYLTSNVDNNLDIPTLDTHDTNEFLFAHLSADKKLKLNSFTTDGYFLDNPEKLSDLFYNLNN